MNFPRLSIASVDGKQHLSKVVFVHSSNFHLISGSYSYTQGMHDSTNSDPDFMNTIIAGDGSWVYGFEPETKSFRQFTYNENPTRVVNTTALKCYLPSNDVIDRREKSRHACEVQGHLMQARFIFLKQ